MAERRVLGAEAPRPIEIDRHGGEPFAKSRGLQHGAPVLRDEAAAVEGRVVQIAFQASSKATVDFRRIMLKRLTHTGSTLRARSIADKGAIARAVETYVLPLIAAGRVRPLVDSTFPLAQVSAAHARMETSAHIGKIVLTVASA